MTRRFLGFSPVFASWHSRVANGTFPFKPGDGPQICAMYWHMTKPSDFTEALTSPSVARNRDPILSVLRRLLPPTGQVLEIASGTSEHAVHFAAALPQLT